ncbi:MAG: hypothetical protein HQL46_16650 [Gammaproteobacteria bacterium]|nr:hypothetical protein [Gammaproteobacteria bacterium]
MALGELEMSVFPGESITITGPAQINVQGGLSASVMQQGGLMAKGQFPIATTGAAKPIALTGGGKVSAIKTVAATGGVKSVALASTLTTMAPTIMTVAVLFASGYLLFKANQKVLKQVDEKFA